MNIRSSRTLHSIFNKKKKKRKRGKVEKERQKNTRRNVEKTCSRIILAIFFVLIQYEIFFKLTRDNHLLSSGIKF